MGASSRRSISFCSQNVSCSIHCITLCCWIFPLSAFTVYFFSIPCQGERSSKHDVNKRFELKQEIKGMIRDEEERERRRERVCVSARDRLST